MGLLPHKESANMFGVGELEDTGAGDEKRLWLPCLSGEEGSWGEAPLACLPLIRLQALSSPNQE